MTKSGSTFKSHRIAGRFLRCLCLGMLVLLGISTFAGNATRAQEVMILTGTDPNFLPITLAAEKGFFKDEGLTVSHRMFPSGADAMLAFRAIGAQFVASGDLPSLILWSQGGDAVGVAPFFASSDNLFGVVSADIKSPADLKGKKIAIKKSSTSEYFVHVYLTDNGVDPASVDIINLSPPEMVPALVAEQIDGFFIWRPYPSQAQKILGDKIRFLTTASGYYVERMYLSVAREFAASDPEAVEKVIRALSRAIEYAYANPDDAAKVVAAKIKTDPAIVMEVISLKPFDLTYDEGAGKELENLSQFLVDGGKLDKQVDSSNVMDAQYLRSVNPKLAP